jgi:hypothetical protein
VQQPTPARWATHDLDVDPGCVLRKSFRDYLRATERQYGSIPTMDSEDRDRSFSAALPVDDCLIARHRSGTILGTVRKASQVRHESTPAREQTARSVDKLLGDRTGEHAENGAAAGPLFSSVKGRGWEGVLVRQSAYVCMTGRRNGDASAPRCF